MQLQHSLDITSVVRKSLGIKAPARTRRTYSERRELHFHEYDRRHYLRSITISGDAYFDTWDYSDGDVLYIDERLKPIDGDVVLYKHSEGMDLRVYQPVSQKLTVRKKCTDSEPPEPELEAIEVIDNAVIGVVVFDLRRRMMPSQKKETQEPC